MKDSPDPNNNQYKKWLTFINIPFQMGIVIFVFVEIGLWLDEKYPNNFSVYTIICAFSSIFISLYNVLRQIRNLNK